MTCKDVIDEVKIAYDENGIPYMLEAFGSEAEHINRLLSAEFQGRLIELPKKQLLKKALSEYFYIRDVYACNITRVNEAMETGNTNLLDFYEFSEEVINDMAEYINDAIETER